MQPDRGWLGAADVAADVQAYLAKFQVEEAVQQAVNSAIAAKSPDPVLHVADLLEKRGLEIEADLAAAAAPPEAEALTSLPERPAAAAPPRPSQ